MAKLSKDDVLAAITCYRQGLVSGKRSDLNGADLTGLDLSKVEFHGISLIEADLSSCDLNRADLRHCDCTGADFEESYLNETVLSGATLYNAIFAGADIDGVVGIALAAGIIDAGFDGRGYRFVGVNHDRGWMVKAGCRWFTMQEAEDHWTRKENNDARARLGVIKASPVFVTIPEPPAIEGGEPGFIAD